MSSNFTGVTFAEQRVSPSDDALIRRMILPDGVLSGCDLSYSGSTLTMSAGYLIACGRQFRHPSAQNWAVIDATSGFARLLITIDLTKTATVDAFEQIVDTIEYAASEDGFPALVQDDINGVGTKYQLVACVVSLGTGGITGVVYQMGISSIMEMLASFRSGIEMTKLWENASPTSAFAAQTVALDLSGYDGVMVTFKSLSDGTDVRITTGFIPFGIKGVGMLTHSDAASMRKRNFIASETGVTFETGYKTSDDSSSTKHAIPTTIYGVKGVTSL